MSPIIHTLEHGQLLPDDYAAIVALCSRAYKCDFAPYLALLPAATHVVLRFHGQIVSHAAWITRWLQPPGLPLLRTAYVEAVATEPFYAKRGYASAVMRELQRQIITFEVGALSPATYSVYERLGWERWYGPLFARKDGGLIALPDEEAMILRFAHSPALDLNAPLSIEWRDGEVW